MQDPRAAVGSPWPQSPKSNELLVQENEASAQTMPTLPWLAHAPYPTESTQQQQMQGVLR